MIRLHVLLRRLHDLKIVIVQHDWVRMEFSASSALVKLHLSFPTARRDRVSVVANLRLFLIKVEGYTSPPAEKDTMVWTSMERL